MEVIFLTYLNRSGSTYLANLLSSSEKIIAFPEAEILVSLFLEDPFSNYNPQDKDKRDYLLSLLYNDPKLKYWDLGSEVFDPATNNARNVDQFLKILTAYRDRFKPGATVFLFKAERLIHLIRKVRWDKTGVKTSFIALMRDPRAVYASQSRTISPLDGKPLSENPVYTALQWKQFAGICSYGGRMDAFSLVQYEDMIISGQKFIEQLCARLGMDPGSITPGRGDLYRRIPQDHRAIHEGIQMGPLAEKTDEWERVLTVKEARLIEHTAASLIRSNGYQLSEPVNNCYLYLIRFYREIIYFVNVLSRKAAFHIRHSK